MRRVRALGTFGDMLQARATDADPDDQFTMRYEYAVWPADNPTTQTVLTRDGNAVAFSTVNIPDGHTYSLAGPRNRPGGRHLTLVRHLLVRRRPELSTVSSTPARDQRRRLECLIPDIERPE